MLVEQSGHENYGRDHTRRICLIFYQLLPTTSVGNEYGQQMRIQILILGFTGLNAHQYLLFPLSLRSLEKRERQIRRRLFTSTIKRSRHEIKRCSRAVAIKKFTQKCHTRRSVGLLVNIFVAVTIVTS